MLGVGPYDCASLLGRSARCFASTIATAPGANRLSSRRMGEKRVTSRKRAIVKAV